MIPPKAVKQTVLYEKPYHVYDYTARFILIKALKQPNLVRFISFIIRVLEPAILFELLLKKNIYFPYFGNLTVL